MILKRILVVIAACAFLTGCSKSLDDQMNEYLAFYYPATTDATYNIVFEWGEYVITAEKPLNKKAHKDSEKYRGYITMRPRVTKPSPELKPVIYLVTPKGAVWTIAPTSEIAKLKKRKEITVTRRPGSTSTQTTTINSPSEPVIDHFMANKAKWSKYGTLTRSGGKSSLTLAKK